MTLTYRDSGLYNNSSNDPFFIKKEINLGIDIDNINKISEEINYDIDLYNEYYKDKFGKVSSDELTNLVKEEFCHGLYHSRNTFYIPEKYNPLKALENGFIPFEHKGIGMLAFPGGDPRANLEMYQFDIDYSLDKDGIFCSPSSRRDDIALEGRIGKEMLQCMLEKASELREMEKGIEDEIDKEIEKEIKENKEYYMYEDEYER